MYISETFLSENKKLDVRSGSSTVKMATHCLHPCMTFFRVRPFIFQFAKLVVYNKKNCYSTLTGADEGAIFMSLGSLFK
jgi:hypothetical protein